MSRATARTSTGRFFDGKTADPQDLSMSLDQAMLRGKAADQSLVLEWKAADILVLQEPDGKRRAVITSRTDSMARLHLNKSAFTWLAPLLSRQARPRSPISITAGSLFFWCMLSLAVVGGVLWSIPRLAGYITGYVPQEFSAVIGDSAINMLIGEHKICMNEAGMRSLDIMLYTLQLPQNAHVQVQVVESREVNAFAAPGGRIVVYSGLIQEAGGPDEVAGVIAHEVGHVLARHPLEGLIRSLGLAFIIQFMFGATSDLGEYGQALLNLKYSREVERQADSLALQILENSGVDPNGLKAFFERMQEKYPETSSDIMGYFSTHPKTSERIASIPASNAHPGDYVPILSASEWQALRGICTRKGR